MAGRLLVGVIVWTPEPGMANATVSTVGEASPAAHSPATAPEAVLPLAACIASRRVHSPSSGRKQDKPGKFTERLSLAPTSPSWRGTPREYFVIERREHGSYDKALPETGFVIWRMVEDGNAKSLYRLNPHGKRTWNPKDGAKAPLPLTWSDGTLAGLMVVDPARPDEVSLIKY